MNENDYSTHSDWYSGGQGSNVPQGKKKHTALKVTMICVCAAILLCAVLYLAFGSFITHKVITDSSSGQTATMPNDWQDYLEQYYSSTSVTKAEVDLPKSDYNGSFAPKLETTAGEELSWQQIYEKCLPSVVSVEAKESDGSGSYMGTGIVLSADGLIVTNTHIIDGCDSASVTLSDGSSYDAKLVAADGQSDISVLKIDATGLTPAEFGDSSALKVGDSVAAIGNPLGKDLTGTMTNGIVSAINRGITYNGHVMTLIQTNAAINEGNSGGPLIDIYGRVVGITNMKMMSSYSSIEGIGFAIPSSSFSAVVSQLISGGSVTGRPSIGITVGPVTDYVSKYYDIPNGLYVSGVADGSDAEKQGVKKGDIITAVNGTSVTTTKQVNDIKDSMKVGEAMKLTIWRNGKNVEISIKLVESSSVY